MLRLRPPPKRWRHEALEGAVNTPEAREAVGQQSAGEELAKLLLDEAGQAATGRLTGGFLRW